ncbi:hypothetical protein AFLA70_74g003310 [Aspergillus flavus AF70]|nr:hypothetical protein AFLA70_74g003310 [Aspergillus flavus AF70]
MASLRSATAATYAKELLEFTTAVEIQKTKTALPVLRLRMAIVPKR